MTLYFFLLKIVVKVENFDVYTYNFCKNNNIKMINCDCRTTSAWNKNVDLRDFCLIWAKLWEVIST